MLEPTSTTTTPDWGYRRVRVGGVDVTFVRDVRTEVGAASWTEPYGEESLGLRFPGITNWDVQAGTFSWLGKGKRVELRHYDADMEFVKVLGRWFVTDIDVSGGVVTLLCQGEYAGKAALSINKPPPFPKKKQVDIGRLIYGATVGRKKKFGGSIPNIGVTTASRGSLSQTRLSRLDELLDMAFDSSGQWTVARHATLPGRYVVRRKDYTTEDLSLPLLAGSAIQWSLRTDVLASPNSIFGEWETPLGRRGRNVLAPNRDDDRPTYNGPYSQGDSGSDINILTRELWSQGYSDPRTDYRGSSFTSDVTEAVKDAQRTAGLSRTGVVNEQTWNAIFAGYARTGAASEAAKFFPIAIDPRVSTFLYSSNGSVRGRNPNFTADLVRVEEYINYGSGVQRSQVVRHAQRIIDNTGDLVWYGSITLNGVDPPEMHRMDIREGMNVRLYGLPDSPLAHVVKVTQNDENSVTLEVDTAGRDWRTVAALKRRERDPDALLRRAHRNLRKSQKSSDRYVSWDEESGSGEFRIAGQGGRWVVKRVIGGVVEGVVSMKADADPDRAFVLALFGSRVTVKELNRWVGDPTAQQTESGQDYDPFNTPSGRLWRDKRNLIEAWGRPGQLAGYSPGQQSDGHPITGRLRDKGLWHCESNKAPYLWAAIWVAGGDADVDVTFRVLDQP